MKKSFILVALAITAGTVFSQTMVVKKADGSYQEITITISVELSFYLPCSGTPTVLYDSKTYNTLQIGTQCWLKENLNVGTRIDGTTGQTNNTPTNIIEKHCYDNLESNCTTYGALYQWAEAVQYLNGAANTTSPDPAFSGNVQGICPTGWHIPTLSELQTLGTAVSNNGNALKAGGQGTGSGIGTNTSGFSALLAGYRGGGFSGLGYYALFWSSTEGNASSAYNLGLDNNNSDIDFYYNNKVNGFSVRCLKD